MPHDVFPLSRILITALVCAVVAFLILVARVRSAPGQGTVRTEAILALLIGVLVVIWRIVSNHWYLNDDFFPGVSPSDVGSGVLVFLGLLALPRLHDGGRAWVVTSALTAVAVFVCNVVFI